MSPPPGPDRLLHLLRSLGEVVTGAAHDGQRALEEVLADACPALAVWVEPLPRALRHPVAEAAVRRGRPLVRRTAQLPYAAHPGLPDEALLLAVADDRRTPTRVGFVVRPLDAAFTSTDVARAEAVLALAGPLLGGGARGRPPRATGGTIDLRDPTVVVGGTARAGTARPVRRSGERLVVDERLRTLGRYRLHRRSGRAVATRT